MKDLYSGLHPSALECSCLSELRNTASHKQHNEKNVSFSCGFVSDILSSKCNIFPIRSAKQLLPVCPISASSKRALPSMNKCLPVVVPLPAPLGSQALSLSHVPACVVSWTALRAKGKTRLSRCLLIPRCLCRAKSSIFHIILIF